jgi:hypothetical protein
MRLHLDAIQGGFEVQLHHGMNVGAAPRATRAAPKERI